jgi:hypothetical protein
MIPVQSQLIWASSMGARAPFPEEDLSVCDHDTSARDFLRRMQSGAINPEAFR